MMQDHEVNASWMAKLSTLQPDIPMNNKGFMSNALSNVKGRKSGNKIT